MNDTIRILHVDDDPDFTNIVGTFLKRGSEDFEIVSCTNTEEALEHFSAGESGFDCVVSDYDMPGKSGIEFLEFLRENHQELPFILYTGKGSEEVASEAISNGATGYLQKESGTGQYELLANRIRNAVEQYRSRKLAKNLERVRTLVRDVNQSLVRASSREEIETQVSDILARSTAYKFAVIAEVDSETEQIQPHTWAGGVEAFLEEFEMSVAEGTPGRQAPGGRAYHDHELAIVQDIETDPAYEKWRDLALEHGIQSLAVVPLEYEDTLYGLLALLADRPFAFDDTEQEVIAELGGDIAHAIHAQMVRNELRRKERRYQSIFNDPNILVGLIGLDGTVLDINETALSYVDATLAELIGTPFHEAPWFEHSTEVQEEAKALIDRAASGEYADFELELVKPDGEAYVVEGVFRPVFDEAGNVVSLIISDREVTERKERERELERIQDFFEEAERLGNLGGWEFDASGNAVWTEGTRRILEVDESFEPTVEEGITFYHPDDRDVVRNAVENSLEGGNSFNVEARLITAEDNVRWVRTRGEPMEDVDNEVRIRGFIQDITDQKNRERDLNKAKSQLEAAVVAGNVATWEWHVPDDTLVTGPEFARKFGVDPDEAREGVPLGRFLPSIHEGDREQVGQRIQAALESCGSYEEEYRVWDADDELRWVVARGHVECDDGGNPERFPGALTDITARKQVEKELQRKNARLDEFTSIVSHDLQNPLTVAEGNLDLARSESDSDYLDAVNRAHERMRSLINELLMIAQEGEAVDEVIRVDLDVLVKACWKNVDTGDASLKMSTSQSVRADEGRLQQLFENLFANAVKHAGAGVTITVGDLDQGFYVEDDGPGIPPEHRDEVFEPGFTTATDGTGFGLVIVKRIAEAHGWTIRLAGAHGGGARFEITGVEIVEG